MVAFELKTKQDIQDFATGCCFFGCGGGGDPEAGIVALTEVLEKGKPLQVTSFDDLKDDDTYASVFLMGSIAPKTDEIIAKQKRNGVPVDPPYSPQEMLSKSLDVLEEYTGKKISALFAIELGGGNSCMPMSVGFDKGLTYIDADAAGRAYPQMTQALPLVMDKPCLPVAIVNGYGDTNILTRCVNSQMIERNGKMLADSGFGMVAHACYIMSGKEVKDALVPGTLSQCFKIGKTIREANEVGKDPVAAAAEAAGGYVLAKTKKVKKEGKTIDGLYYGTLELEGVDEFAGNTYKLWFENEYHVMWKNGKPWITSPDIVQCVDTKTCHPLTNTVIEVGDFVSIVGVPAREQYNSGKPFSVMNPRYYDFEFDHVPMAEVLRQENA